MSLAGPRVARFVLLTGAGISADSGVPTFRGAGGLWEGRRVEDVATPRAWRADPALVWRFYQGRRAALGGFTPNPAHRAICDFERRVRAAGHTCLLVTQNVDDLHERAGSRPLHMHGELAVLRCEACDARVRDLERLDPAVCASCASCGAPRLRPDVVWFGELPYELDRIGAELERCTCFVALGTSGVVYPAAGFLDQARAAGARTIISSLERPENASAGDELVVGRAADVVPALLDGLARELGC
jgi:NAD-dependent deacetylase